MKILVTGATGKVGSRFVSRILAKGYDVRILVRDAEKAASLVERGAKVVVGDLNNADTLPAAVEGMDAVIHIAAFFRSFTDNEGIIKTNHAGTVALANASIAAGVKRFIFTSTSNVYRTDNQRPSKEDDVLMLMTQGHIRPAKLRLKMNSFHFKKAQALMYVYCV